MVVPWTHRHLKDESIGAFCPLGGFWSATFNFTSGGSQVAAFGG